MGGDINMGMKKVGLLSTAAAATAALAFALPAGAAAVLYDASPINEVDQIATAQRITMPTPRWQSESYTPSGGTAVSLRSDGGEVSGQISRQATNVTFYLTEAVKGMTPEQILEAHEDGTLDSTGGLSSNVQFAIVNFGPDGKANYEFVQHGYGNDGDIHFMAYGDQIVESRIAGHEVGGSYYLQMPENRGSLLEQMIEGGAFTSVTSSDNPNGSHIGVVEFGETDNNDVRDEFNQVVADLNNPEKVAEAIANERKILDWSSNVADNVSDDYKQQLIRQTRGDIFKELEDIDPADVDVVRYGGGTASILATVDGLRYKRPNGNTMEVYGCYLKVERDAFGNIIRWEASQTTASLTNISCMPPFLSVTGEDKPYTPSRRASTDPVEGVTNEVLREKGVDDSLPYPHGGGGVDDVVRDKVVYKSQFDPDSDVKKPGGGGTLPQVPEQPPAVPLPAPFLLLGGALCALGAFSPRVRAFPRNVVRFVYS